jgi:hypothetical protein
MLNRLDDDAELEAAKLQLRRREESLAAGQRRRQRDMNLRLLGQLAAVLAFAALLAYIHYF